MSPTIDRELVKHSAWSVIKLRTTWLTMEKNIFHIMKNLFFLLRKKHLQTYGVITYLCTEKDGRKNICYASDINYILNESLLYFFFYTEHWKNEKESNMFCLLDHS